MILVKKGEINAYRILGMLSLSGSDGAEV